MLTQRQQKIFEQYLDPMQHETDLAGWFFANVGTSIALGISCVKEKNERGVRPILLELQQRTI